MKKEEGRAYNLTSDTDQKILEVGKSNNETKIDDKTSFENFKTLYAGKIAEKCLADYGTDEDKDLLEDTAKEMYLTSQELIPTEDTKSDGVLEDEKTKKEEGKVELDNKSKFLAHILNGVVSDVQDKFNVTATGELDTANTNKVVVTLKGNTLDLIDATSYLAKAIRRDDVDFTFEDTIKDNTVKCTISPKSIKTEGVRLNKELVAKMDDPQFQYLAYFADNIDGIEKVIDNCTDKSKIKVYKEILKSARAFNSGRTKTESVTVDEISKIHSEINQANSLKEIQNAIDRISDKSLQRQVQITFDEYDKDDNEDMDEDLEEVKDEIIQTLEDNAEYDEEPLTESKLTEDWNKEDLEYRYRLLSRLIQDCEYYINNPAKQTASKHLWAGNVKDQIKTMRDILDSFKEDEKPEWTSMTEIDELEKQMTEDTKTESKDGKENPEYQSFSEDMNEIERTINFIKQPKNKDAQEILADIKDYLNKLWVEKEQHTFGIKYDESKKITEEVTDEDLASDYSKRVKDEITDQGRKNFNTLKEIIHDGEDKVEVDGFYFSSKAVNILDNTDTKHNLNSFMNLTKSDILNMIDDNDSIEEVIDELFEEYEPNSALTWADSFVTIMNKLDTTDVEDIEEYDESEQLEESRPDKEAARDKMFRDSRKKLNMTHTFTTKEEVLEYLNKCEDETDIMNVNNNISDTELRNYMLDLGTQFQEDTGKYPTNDPEGFKKYMIDGLTKYNKDKKEESPKADKVLADIINDEKDSVEGYRDTIMEMGLSKEDFIDMITTENEHKLMNEKGLTKDQEAEVYGKLYDTMI